MYQDYKSEVNNEFVIRGNSAILKCHVPSFVADFVSVQAWVDGEGGVYFPSTSYGNQRPQGKACLGEEEEEEEEEEVVVVVVMPTGSD